MNRNILKSKALRFLALSAAFVAAVQLLAGYLAGRPLKPTSEADMSSTSVKIVRMDERSGGTGVILSSNARASSILTNRHVCRVIENGGLVITSNNQKHLVSTYQASDWYDLCLVTVAANLHINTSIARSAPTDFAPATVSGHPRLLPNVISRGHYSEREIIDVFMGVRPCTEADAQKNPLLCLLLGGIPQISRFEAQLVTALSQPGSSGSAVFNENGEITNLVFAGQGDLSYSYTMPYEAITQFMYHEVDLISPKHPSATMDFAPSMGESRVDSDRKFFELCKQENLDEKVKQQISKACSVIRGDLLWRNY